MRHELDKMLIVGISVPIEELQWIFPLVVQAKKTKGNCIYLNLRNFNESCVHDPLPTPFTDEVLEKGREVYSFADGFSKYHQVKITM